MKTAHQVDSFRILLLYGDGLEDRLKKPLGKLMSHGFKVDSSHAIQESLKLIESHIPHAVVVDCATLTGEMEL